MALCDRCEPKAPSLGIVSISALLTAYGRVGLEHSLVAMWTPASRMTLKGPFIKLPTGFKTPPDSKSTWRVQQRHGRS